MNDRLVEILRSAQVVLFDFDGPLCDVFAGLPADRVARDLEQSLGRTVASDDPLEVLRASAADGPDVVRSIEDALIAAERDAIAVSVPNTPGVSAIGVLDDSGRTVGIVSNNSADAVRDFLRKESVDARVSPLVGRAYAQPDLMKPSPWPLIQAVSATGVPGARTVLIGDSLTDIESATTAGMSCVALANKPGKRALFEAAGAAVVVDDMAELLAASRQL